MRENCLKLLCTLSKMKFRHGLISPSDHRSRMLSSIEVVVGVHPLSPLSCHDPTSKLRFFGLVRDRFW
jgi:hypothetical protein